MPFRTATEQIADLKSGKTSSRELVDAAIDQIQKADETINAVVVRDFDRSSALPQSLDNVTPADAYFGRASTIINQRERIKATDYRTSALAAPQARRLTSAPRRGRGSANLRRGLSQMF